MEHHLPGHLRDSDNDPSADRARALAALEQFANHDDLAMAVTILEDLAASSELLGAHRHQPKITIFGSARIDVEHPAYAQVHELAGLLADDGYTVITGGGPGIMTAGLEGAGPGHAIGVAITLPFETPYSKFPNVLQQRFLTRKLAMVRHVRGFVAAAGGFGTLDEVLEVLCLLQTGKKRPAPVVLLDPPGEDAWARFDVWVRETLVPAGMINEQDLSLYRVVDSVEAAHAEIVHFSRRYKGIPYELTSGDPMALLVEPALTTSEISQLSARFVRLAPTGFWPISTSQGPAIAFDFDRRQWGQLRQLIDALNVLN